VNAALDRKSISAVAIAPTENQLFDHLDDG